MINHKPLVPGFDRRKTGDYFSTFLNKKLHSFNDIPSRINYKTKTKQWHKNGRLHRNNDLPSVVRWLKEDAFNVEQQKIWYSNGMKHRDGDKPAIISITTTYFTNGKLRTFHSQKRWIKNNVPHRDGGKPAVVEVIQWYDHTGKINKDNSFEEFWVEGKKHRNGDKPAYIGIEKNTMLNNRIVFKKIFYKNNVIHRDGGKPAYISNEFAIVNNTMERPVFTMRKYFVEGTVHRDGDKPAIFILSRNDVTNQVEYVKSIFLKEGKLHRESNKPAYYSLTRDEKEYFGCFYDNEPHCDNNEPAYLVRDYKENKEYFEFYKAGMIVEDNTVSAQKFLLNKLNKIEPVFDEVKIQEFPLSQLISLVNSLGRLEQVASVPFSHSREMYQNFNTHFDSV